MEHAQEVYSIKEARFVCLTIMSAPDYMTVGVTVYL